jgi:hypothetical protein
VRPQISIDRYKWQNRFLMAIVGLALISTSVAWCQLPDNLVTVQHPGGLTRLDVEYPALTMSGTNAWIYSPAGRFQFRTGASAPIGGDPTRIGDENRILASMSEDGQHGLVFTSHTTVAIDPERVIADSDDGQLIYEINSLMQDESTVAEPSLLTNYWLASPVAGSRDIVGTYRLPVRFDEDDRPIEFIEVRQALTLIGDTLQVENIVYNTSSQSHRIGLRVVFDGLFDTGNVQDGRPIVLPDGTVITRETELPDRNTGIGLPDTWVTYDDPVNPRVAIRGVVQNNDISDAGAASRAAGAPDSIMWGQRRNIGMAGQYYVSPNPQASLVGEDWAYAVRWQPVNVDAGQSCRFVTYYGVGMSTPDYNRPYAFMVYAPHSLVAQAGDNPATPDDIEEFYLSDAQGRSPFPISAYIDNFGSDTILDASVRLRLPAGFDLVEGETLTKSAGTIGRNELKSVTWYVRATAARPGSYTIRFTGPRGKVLESTINVPAMPLLPPVISPRGLEMVSIPYQFHNDDAEWVLQDLGSLQPGGNATVVRWDPKAAQYRWFPDPITTSVQPGVGFWLVNRARDTVRLPADATPIDHDQTFSLRLEPGWNQIGNPFTVPLRLDQLKVSGSAGGEWSMEDAYSRLLLVPTIFEYDPLVNDYVWNTNLAAGRLDPFKGYWILCSDAVTLQFPPPSQIAVTAVDTKGTPTTSDSDSASWTVDLTVAGAGQVRANRAFGCHRDAKEGFDRFDLPQPPVATAGNGAALTASFLSEDTGLPLLVDRRPARGKSAWRLAVGSAASDQDITVSWGDLSGVAGDTVLTLIDTTSGKRCYMRTASSYTYRTRSANETRVLELVAQQRGNGTLAVSSLNAQQTAGGQVAVSYAVTVPASVDIVIRNIAGLPVATIARENAVPAGVNSVSWNGCNMSGTTVPAGRYICQISARCPETGQVANMLTTFAISR